MEKLQLYAANTEDSNKESMEDESPDGKKGGKTPMSKDNKMGE